MSKPLLVGVSFLREGRGYEYVLKKGEWEGEYGKPGGEIASKVEPGSEVYFMIYQTLPRWNRRCAWGELGWPKSEMDKARKKVKEYESKYGCFLGGVFGHGIVDDVCRLVNPKGAIYTRIKLRRFFHYSRYVDIRQHLRAERKNWGQFLSHHGFELRPSMVKEIKREGRPWKTKTFER